ncbi:coiled-coil domain-containing protein [Puerhibacterium puerhi]|uniref:hypothetical protein n=1 Tax=Puerhibacterium puerhi TaxID=2692623 RepID=UPI00135AD4CC|nr:hypothetical protein [Puerhibacterium puerhi]
MSAQQPVDVDALVDALYAGPLEDFVAARDAAAKQVAASGDRVGAARVKRLAKPTVAAWVINRVARDRPDDVAALTAIGDELRAATQDRDRGRIKALDRLRRERTDALVHAVRAAGAVDGRPVSDAVLDRLAETLTAAVMDEDAGAVVRAGRLGRALQHVGFGIVDEGGEPADVVSLRAGVPEPAASTPGAAEPAEEDERAAAERAVAEAEAQVDRLEARRDDAERRLREAQEAAGERARELAGLEEEIERLLARRDAARAAQDAARSAQEDARQALAAVEDELDAAEDQAAAARRRRREARRRGS